MFCTKCGQQLDDGLKFCTACGSPVEKVEPRVNSMDELADLDSKSSDKKAFDDKTPDGEPSDVLDVTSEPAMSSNVAHAVPVDATIALQPFVPDESTTYSAINPEDDSSIASGKRGKRKRTLAIGSVAAAVVIAAVGVMFALGVFDPNPRIDPENFPNDVIRGAVLEQLDLDGDGRLSEEEAEAATAIVLTPEGAEFVIDGDEFNVQAVRDDIKNKAQVSDDGQTGEDGSPNATAQSEPTSQSNDVDTVSPSIKRFPNLKYLVADNMDLESIDLHEMPQLEYADLRGNPNLRTFDLSNNANIKVLFCDEDANVTGLDEAGLYYTDLITGIQFEGNGAPKPITIEYDSFARPITANGASYIYDDASRLIRIEKTESSGNVRFEEFAYGANGLLSSVLLHDAVGSSPGYDSCYYGYDMAGNVVQNIAGNSSSASGPFDFYNARIYGYQNNVLSSFKGSSSSALITMAENGMVSDICMDTSSSQSLTNYSYSASGSLAKKVLTNSSRSGSSYVNECSTEYSESGNPISTTTNYGTKESNTYVCNADGYIKEIVWNSESFDYSGTTGKISYIKRVGALDDRASERFVPVIRPSVQDWSVSLLYPGSLGDWFASSSQNIPVSILVRGPMTEVSKRIGLFDNMLDCPNEIKLAAYDHDHRNDGLNLSAEQLIAESGVQELFAKAAQATLPTPASTFVNDPVYGSVVKQYLKASKNASRSWAGNSHPESSDYPDIPKDILNLFGLHASDSKGKNDVVDFAYVDLDSDGVNELAVVAPVIAYSSVSTSSKNDIDVLAVYGQVDGKAVLIEAIAERCYCWIMPDGNLVRLAFGGWGTGEYTVKHWNGKSLQLVQKYMYANMNDEDFQIKTTDNSGNESTSVTSREVAFAKADEFDPHMKLNLVPVPCSLGS